VVTQQNVSVNRAAETSSVTIQKLKVIASVVIVPEEPLMVITPDNKVVNRALKLAPKGSGHKIRLSGCPVDLVGLVYLVHLVRLVNPARKPRLFGLVVLPPEAD